MGLHMSSKVRYIRILCTCPFTIDNLYLVVTLSLFCFPGCINDVANIKTFVKERGFEDSNIRVMTDDQLDTTKIPTRQNMIEGLKWLVSDAQPGDS